MSTARCSRAARRQRVNLAAGTVRPPRLLLLDEPVSALDPANREAALELIATLTDAGRRRARGVPRPRRHAAAGVRVVLDG